MYSSTNNTFMGKSDTAVTEHVFLVESLLFLEKVPLLCYCTSSRLLCVGTNTFLLHVGCVADLLGSLLFTAVFNIFGVLPVRPTTANIACSQRVTSLFFFSLYPPAFRKDSIISHPNHFVRVHVIRVIDRTETPFMSSTSTSDFLHDGSVLTQSNFN